MENIHDLYTDYLPGSFGQATATGLSSMLDGAVPHYRITRPLSGGDFGGKELNRIKGIEVDYEPA